MDSFGAVTIDVHCLMCVSCLAAAACPACYRSHCGYFCANLAMEACLEVLLSGLTGCEGMQRMTALGLSRVKARSPHFLERDHLA